VTHGATLCYNKSFWQGHRFKDVNLGEDTQFGMAARALRQFVLVDAGKNMVVRAHGVDYGPDGLSSTGKPGMAAKDYSRRGNTCETSLHMGTAVVPRVPTEEVPKEFFIPLLKDMPVSNSRLIVHFRGGLGNQMFQYAFGRSLSLARNIPVFFDRSGVDHDPIRSYSMDAYDVEINFNSPLPTGKVFHIKVNDTLVFRPEVFSAPEDSILDGWWQTEKYINASVIRKELSRPRGEPNEETARIAAEIRSVKTSAFVHVRRGDYVTWCGLRPLSYYTEGMDIIRSQFPETRFFIFSDDHDWCRQNLPGIEIVNANTAGNGKAPGTEHWDLWLMSLCSHAVIANSSFGWWGAWLNPDPDRIVVAPKVWWHDTPNDTVPERWVKLDSDITLLGRTLHSRKS
jgi:hypothetical protein